MRLRHLLEQVQQHGLDVVRTDRFVGESGIVAVEFDQIDLEQTQNVLAAGARRRRRIRAVGVQDDVLLGGGKRQSPPSASAFHRRELYGASQSNQSRVREPVLDPSLRGNCYLLIVVAIEYSIFMSRVRNRK